SDTNMNGRQDSGEPGVAGVTVRLLDSVGAHATDDDGVPIPDVTTTSTGAYSFTDLRPGDYQVRFTLPAGYIFTTPNAASTTSANDSDALIISPTVGETAQTTL